MKKTTQPNKNKSADSIGYVELLNAQHSGYIAPFENHTTTQALRERSCELDTLKRQLIHAARKLSEINLAGMNEGVTFECTNGMCAFQGRLTIPLSCPPQDSEVKENQSSN